VGSKLRGGRLRWAAASVAGVGLLALAGCSSQDTAALGRLGFPEAASAQAPHISNLWIGSWIAAGSIGLLVWGMIAWIVIRFRTDHNEMPKQNRYNLPMEIFYTVAPFVVIGVLFYYTILAQNAVRVETPNPQVTVNVVGYKWSWAFNYKSASDPAVGQDVFDIGTIQQVPDLYLPVDQTVRFNLSSPDVNHSFWVPAFYEKMDVVAGRNNNFEVTPNKIGVFRGKCAELCGTYHQSMLFNVHIVSQADYTAHLKNLAARGQTGERRGPANADPQGNAKIYEGEQVGEGR
jgi:cytochrome c oxidase subunit 2